MSASIPFPRPTGVHLRQTLPVELPGIHGCERPVPWADVLCLTLRTQIGIDSVSTTAGDCPIPASGSIRCQLGALPANALVTITMTLRPLVGISGPGARVFDLAALTSIDPNHDNDSVQRANQHAMFPETFRPAWHRPTFRAPAAARSRCRRISVNTLQHGDGDLRRDSDSDFASIETVAAPTGICPGTTMLTCYFFSREPGSADIVDVTLKLNATGTFTSNIRAAPSTT